MAKKKTPQPQPQPKQTQKPKISKKTSQKSQEPQIYEKPQKPQTKQKKKLQKSSDFAFFSDTFYDKLNEFTTLYKEFLTLKTASNGDSKINVELEEATKQVQEHIQEAASQIFKGQLQDTEAWIESEIKKIEEEIKGIEKAYESNRESLMQTGAFTEEEVRKQLGPIQGKIVAKNETRERYQQLLLRSKQIYQ